MRAILIDRPELVRAFYLKGDDDDLLRAHFKHVLAGKSLLVIECGQNSRRFLQTIRMRRRWSGYFGFSLAPDSTISGTYDTK